MRLRASAPDGKPGDVLHTLGRTFSPDGVNEFTAPAGVVLEADTWYHADLDYARRRGTHLRWSEARSAADENGWEIPETAYLKVFSGPWSSYGHAFTMAIKATEFSPVMLSLTPDTIGEAGG